MPADPRARVLVATPGASLKLATAGCLFAALVGAPALATEVDPAGEIERGRQIFLTGKSSGEIPITATLGNQTYPLPGEALPCVNCHGSDGRGRPEGGVEPSNITWEALTRPYVLNAPSGRRHGPYDRRLLIRAITLGVDPAGNPLGIAMPRFRLSKTDAEALASYIEQLAEEREPGIGDTLIRIGTLLPRGRRQAATGDAVEAVLRGIFEEVNADGGIYGRSLELVVRRAGESAEERLRALDGLLGEESVFALLSPFTAGADAALAERTDGAGLPVIGPITQTPRLEALPGRTFYLLSGLDQQVRVLWDFAAGRVAPRPLRAAIVSSAGVATESMVEAIRLQAKSWQTREPVVVPLANDFDPDALAARLAAFDAVFFLGSGNDVARLLNSLEALDAQPDLLIPGPLAGPLIERRSAHVYLGFPDLPSQPMPSVAESWRAFARRHRLPSSYPTTQRLASVAAHLLIAAARATGRELTRTGLVASLEGLYKIDTGWTPPLTYGPNRRIGALGGYVVQVTDGPNGFDRVSGWIEPR